MSGSPFRWVGAKRHLVPLSRELLGKSPPPPRVLSLFYGAGAIEQDIAAPQVAAEANPDLRALYQVLGAKEGPRELLSCLRALDASAPRGIERYRQVRAAQPDTHLERAARFLYLSGLAFNGLWRVNRAGQHNVPPDPGRLARPWPFPSLEDLLQTAERVKRVACWLSDWKEAAALARPGDLVIADPPYLGGFTSYTAAGFELDDQLELASTLRELALRGVNILAFNAPGAATLYEWAHLRVVTRRGSISSATAGRGRVAELMAFVLDSPRSEQLLSEPETRP